VHCPHLDLHVGGDDPGPISLLRPTNSSPLPGLAGPSQPKKTGKKMMNRVVTARAKNQRRLQPIGLWVGGGVKEVGVELLKGKKGRGECRGFGFEI